MMAGTIKEEYPKGAEGWNVSECGQKRGRFNLILKEYLLDIQKMRGGEKE